MWLSQRSQILYDASWWRRAEWKAAPNEPPPPHVLPQLTGTFLAYVFYLYISVPWGEVLVATPKIQPYDGLECSPAPRLDSCSVVRFDQGCWRNPIMGNFVLPLEYCTVWACFGKGFNICPCFPIGFLVFVQPFICASLHCVSFFPYQYTLAKWQHKRMDSQMPHVQSGRRGHQPHGASVERGQWWMCA